MNILVLSCGTRNKIIQYFKKALDGRGRVVATDCSAVAPAPYDADVRYLVPRMTEPGYTEVILDICKKEKINGVFSLIDPELSLLAKEHERFEALGVTVIGSSYELCERTLDKWEMFRWLEEHGYNCAKSYIDKEAFYRDEASGAISYPVFVKPVRGSASIAIQKVYDRETLELLFSKSDNLLIQELLDGQEIGADCYIDLISGEPVSIFTKKKLLMRAGETDKAVSFKDDKLFELIDRFVRESGFRGQIDIDIFDVDSKYYISEVNPRFGGGYPHAQECGMNSPEYIINNLAGNANPPCIGEYEDNVVMMKYVELKILRGVEL